MSKIILSVVIFCAAFATALALKCKTCEDPTCTSFEDQTCPAPPSNMEAACLIFKYKADANAKVESIEKKCVYRNKSGKYDCIKTKTTDVETKCYTCTSDLCNEKDGASKIATGSLAVISVLIALFAPKFL